jgi:peptide subunit release factor 1 (eRF1)
MATKSTPARRALQRFLREIAKPDNGLAIYGSRDIDAALDANRVHTVFMVANGKKPRDGDFGIGVRAYEFDAKDECGRILTQAFGGTAAILKRNR